MLCSVCNAPAGNPGFCESCADLLGHIGPSGLELLNRQQKRSEHVYAVVQAEKCPSCNPESLVAVFRSEDAARAWIALQTNKGRYHVETLEVQKS